MSDVPDTEPTNPNPEPTELEQLQAEALDAMIGKVRATDENNNTVSFKRAEFDAWINVQSRDAEQLRAWCESRDIDYDGWVEAAKNVVNIHISDD